MYLDVYERDTSRYMQDTCAIHGIRILITNPPKLDNKPHVTRAVEPAVEALPVEPVEFLSSAVEPVKADSNTPCAWASSSCRAVEFLSSFSVDRLESSVLSSSSLACSFAILHEAL